MSEPAAAPPVQQCAGCKRQVQTRLSCPKCKDLGLPPSWFCNQACFKANWTTHKVLHEVATNVLKEQGPTGGHISVSAGITGKTPEKWEQDMHLKRFHKYKFTGELRPWPITGHRAVPLSIPRPDYALTGVPEGEQREQRVRAPPVVNTEEEIALSRAACRLGREALDLAASLIRPGVTTESIDAAVHNFITSRGAYPSPLNYYEFPKSCCTSVNEVICHGIPDLRPLEEGDIVNVDISVFLNGFHGDLNETFCVGEVSDEKKRLIRASYDSLMAAIEICKPGVPYRRVGDVISSVVQARGYSVVRTYVGHGCGRLFHCRPNVPHYKNNKAIGNMAAGHIFTIEPMINAGTWHDQQWPDDWTVVTTDGQPSAQFEHTLLITETGCEVLTARLPSSPPLNLNDPPLSASDQVEQAERSVASHSSND